jgi:hypothetical protein
MNYSHHFGVNFIAKPPGDDYFKDKIKPGVKRNANREVHAKSSRGPARSQGHR